MPFYQFRQSLVQSVHTQHPHLQDHEALRENCFPCRMPEKRLGMVGTGKTGSLPPMLRTPLRGRVDSAEWLNSQFHILAVRYTHKPTGFVFTNYRFRTKEPKPNLPDMTYRSMTGKTNDHTASKKCSNHTIMRGCKMKIHEDRSHMNIDTRWSKKAMSKKTSTPRRPSRP